MTTTRTLPEFPGYAFGEDGSVWSRWKYHCCKSGRPDHGLSDQWREIKGRIHPKYGYRTVTLKTPNGQRDMRVNRLIALAFHGPPPNPKYHAKHENGNKLDNRAKNIKWGTAKQNIEDKRRHGTIRMTGGKKLTDAAAEKIRKMRAKGMTQKEIAKKFGVNRATISYLLNGKTWRSE